ncbi:MAG: hypothetical protein KH352_06140, partial [Ruminococcus sp.]|nr:hypothetical protein [Candidatus Apopatosoma intestinale]
MMKKFTGFMKYIISGTGVTFMITTLLLWGAAAFLRNKDGMNAVSFRSDTFAAIFVFALLTALISLVFKAKFISPAILRLCLHFVLSMGSFILFVYMTGVTSRGSGMLALTATVGTAMVGTNGIAVGTTVNCTDGTVLRFTGWNTNADGTGTGYGPGDVITVNENTVLYGQWEESAATVRIEKLVAGALGDWDREFSFTYKIGDAATVEFTLKHNDEYTIENVPLGSTVTVTEEDCSQSGYTTSYQIDGADKQN